MDCTLEMALPSVKSRELHDNANSIPVKMD